MHDTGRTGLLSERFYQIFSRGRNWVKCGFQIVLLLSAALDEKNGDIGAEDIF